ncbi:roadblock/LC7 domain-containing protein [Streptomyces sp. NPDC049881]|uniref:roadblock/LC7 domain-containing protein n=1 Tax=Streptomyces sp. NPDC049881 TaxID=3155778 RepID=UPI0034420CC2
MSRQVDWKIERLVAVPRVRHVVVATADGLVAAHSSDLEREGAEKLAAACAGLHSMSATVPDAIGEELVGMRQLMVDLGGMLLFVRTAAEDTRLAVVTDPQVDPAVIGTEMGVWVRQMGDALAVARRTRTAAP